MNLNRGVAVFAVLNLRFAVAQTVTEYPLPTANAMPTSIVAGPDGNLWFTEHGASKIGRITPVGVITEFPLLKFGLPVGIAKGPDGNLWFGDYNAAIGKITTSGVITEYPVPSGAAAYAITQGPDGNMWFTEYLLGNIGKITTSGAVTEYPCTVQGIGVSCSFNVSIVSGPDGNLWFAPTLVGGYLGVITPNGVVSSVVVRANPNGLAVGPDGDIWFAAQGEIGKVPTASPNIPRAFPLDSNTKAVGITTGPDGNLWFTEQITVSGPKIARSTTAGLVTEYPLSNAGASPNGITTGPDGNIWFTELYGNNIGVLKLSGGAATGINVSPTALTFSVPAGGAAPPSQTIQASSGSSTAFTATSSISAPLDGTWLTITPSGNLTTNQGITVSVNPAGISAAGSYSGSVYITSGSTTQTVPVTLNITAPTAGNITSNPSSLSFGYTVGSSILQPLSLYITSAAGPSFAIPYSITSTQSSPGNWLVLTAGGVPNANGVTLTTPSGLGVSAVFGLAAGVYTASIKLTPTGGSPLTVPVTLTVAAAPSLVATPDSLAITYQPGGAPSAIPSIQITEQSGLNVGFTASAQTSPSGWLAVSPSSGTTPGNLVFNVVGAGLAAGTYSGKIVVTPGASGSSPLNIPVTLTVTQSALTASPASLSFTYPPFGPAPTAQVLQISSPGGTAVAFQASQSGFLNITPTSGTTPAAISVSIGPGGLQEAPGKYSSSVVIFGSAGSAPTTVPVSLTVTAAPTIAATQTSFTFSYQTGASVPAAQSFQVTASTSVPVALAAVSYASWLLLNAGDENTPATYTVSVNPTGLTPGKYTSSISVFEQLYGGQQALPQISIPVTLTVTAGTAIAASPATLTFSGQSGAQVGPSQTVQVAASGGVAVPFSAVPTSTGNWLTILPSAGTTPAGLVVTATPAFLVAGTYQGSILINGTANVPVTFNVSAANNAPIPSITRVVNGASYSSGAISPGEIVTIAGTNLGPATALGLSLDSSGNVATSLGGVSVAVNGYYAPLLYVSATQINCVIPYEIAFAQTYSFAVQYGTQSGLFSGSIGPTAPGIFTAIASGTGQAAVLNGSGSVNNATNPATAGSTVVIYMTGEGQTSPAGVTGKVTTVNTSSGPLTPQPITPPAVTIGGSPALVTFYGEAPGLVSGVLQINAIVPSGLAVGNVALAISFGTANTQSGVTVAVQ